MYELSPDIDLEMPHKTNCANLPQTKQENYFRQHSIVQMKIKPNNTTSNRLISVYLFSLAILALILALSIQISDGAALNSPVGKYKSSHDRGCYYMLQHFKNGEQIKTDEPCLNCTCENSMLMCYLRVCPYVKPVGDRCIIERVPGECCPKITCTDVAPVSDGLEQELEPDTIAPITTTTTSTTTSTTPSTTSLLTSRNYDVAFTNASEVSSGAGGCMFGDKYYHEGAQMPSDPTKPCEVCYCIRNHSACVMQDCALEVGGCTPIYQSGGCCPTRYNCSSVNVFTTPRPLAALPESSTRRRFWESNTSAISSSSTTMQSIINYSTTTTAKPIAFPDFGRTSSILPPIGCKAPNSSRTYADGERVPSKNKCEHCYCMRSEIVCAVQECRPPCDGCVPIIDSNDQCCPKRYECVAPTQRVPIDNIIDVQDSTTTSQSVTTSPYDLARTNTPSNISDIGSLLVTTQSLANNTVSTPTLPDEINVIGYNSSSFTVVPDSSKSESSVMTTRQTKAPLKPISPKLSLNDDDNTDEMMQEQDLAKSTKADPSANVDGFNLHGEREQEADSPKTNSRFVAPEGSQPIASSPISESNEVSPPFLTSTIAPPTTRENVSPSNPVQIDTTLATTVSPEAAGIGDNMKKSRPSVVSSSIPGEGSCRYNGRMYQNGQEVKSKDNCMEICMCINSVVYCDEVDCPKGPANQDKCQRIVVEGECCPKYVCEEELTTTPSTNNIETSSASSSGTSPADSVSITVIPTTLASEPSLITNEGSSTPETSPPSPVAVTEPTENIDTTTRSIGVESSPAPFTTQIPEQPSPIATSSVINEIENQKSTPASQDTKILDATTELPTTVRVDSTSAASTTLTPEEPSSNVVGSTVNELEPPKLVPVNQETKPADTTTETSTTVRLDSTPVPVVPTTISSEQQPSPTSEISKSEQNEPATTFAISESTPASEASATEAATTLRTDMSSVAITTSSPEPQTSTPVDTSSSREAESSSPGTVVPDTKVFESTTEAPAITTVRIDSSTIATATQTSELPSSTSDLSRTEQTESSSSSTVSQDVKSIESTTEAPTTVRVESSSIAPTTVIANQQPVMKEESPLIPETGSPSPTTTTESTKSDSTTMDSAKAETSSASPATLIPEQPSSIATSSVINEIETQKPTPASQDTKILDATTEAPTTVRVDSSSAAPTTLIPEQPPSDVVSSTVSELEPPKPPSETKDTKILEAFTTISPDSSSASPTTLVPEQPSSIVVSPAVDKVESLKLDPVSQDGKAIDSTTETSTTVRIDSSSIVPTTLIPEQQLPTSESPTASSADSKAITESTKIPELSSAAPTTLMSEQPSSDVVGSTANELEPPKQPSETKDTKIPDATTEAFTTVNPDSSSASPTTLVPEQPSLIVISPAVNEIEPPKQTSVSQDSTILDTTTEVPPTVRPDTTTTGSIASVPEQPFEIVPSPGANELESPKLVPVIQDSKSAEATTVTPTTFRVDSSPMEATTPSSEPSSSTSGQSSSTPENLTGRENLPPGPAIEVKTIDSTTQAPTTVRIVSSSTLATEEPFVSNEGSSTAGTGFSEPTALTETMENIDTSVGNDKVESSPASPTTSVPEQSTSTAANPALNEVESPKQTSASHDTKILDATPETPTTVRVDSSSAVPTTLMPEQPSSIVVSSTVNELEPPKLVPVNQDTKPSDTTTETSTTTRLDLTTVPAITSISDQQPESRTTPESDSPSLTTIIETSKFIETSTESVTTESSSAASTTVTPEQPSSIVVGSTVNELEPPKLVPVNQETKPADTTTETSTTVRLDSTPVPVVPTTISSEQQPSPTSEISKSEQNEPATTFAISESTPASEASATEAATTLRTDMSSVAITTSSPEPQTSTPVDTSSSREAESSSPGTVVPDTKVFESTTEAPATTTVRIDSSSIATATQTSELPSSTSDLSRTEQTESSSSSTVSQDVKSIESTTEVPTTARVESSSIAPTTVIADQQPVMKEESPLIPETGSPSPTTTSETTKSDSTTMDSARVATSSAAPTTLIPEQPPSNVVSSTANVLEPPKPLSETKDTKISDATTEAFTTISPDSSSASPTTLVPEQPPSIVVSPAVDKVESLKLDPVSQDGKAIDSTTETSTTVRIDSSSIVPTTLIPEQQLPTSESPTASSADSKAITESTKNVDTTTEISGNVGIELSSVVPTSLMSEQPPPIANSPVVNEIEPPKQTSVSQDSTILDTTTEVPPTVRPDTTTTGSIASVPEQPFEIVPSPGANELESPKLVPVIQDSKSAEATTVTPTTFRVDSSPMEATTPSSEPSSSTYENLTGRENLPSGQAMEVKTVDLTTEAIAITKPTSVSPDTKIVDATTDAQTTVGVESSPASPTTLIPEQPSSIATSSVINEIETQKPTPASQDTKILDATTEAPTTVRVDSSSAVPTTLIPDQPPSNVVSSTVSELEPPKLVPVNQDTKPADTTTETPSTVRLDSTSVSATSISDQQPESLTNPETGSSSPTVATETTKSDSTTMDSARVETSSAASTTVTPEQPSSIVVGSTVNELEPPKLLPVNQETKPVDTTTETTTTVRLDSTPVPVVPTTISSEQQPSPTSEISKSEQNEPATTFAISESTPASEATGTEAATTLRTDMSSVAITTSSPEPQTSTPVDTSSSREAESSSPGTVVPDTKVFESTTEAPATTTVRIDSSSIATATQTSELPSSTSDLSRTEQTESSSSSTVSQDVKSIELTTEAPTTARVESSPTVATIPDTNSSSITVETASSGKVESPGSITVTESTRVSEMTSEIPSLSSVTSSPGDEFLAGLMTTMSTSFKPVDVTTIIPSIRGSPASITIPWSDIKSNSTVMEPQVTSLPPITLSATNYSSHETKSPVHESTQSSPAEPDYEEISEDSGCEYEGKTYNSAQQIPRSNPCDFCFCFRGDIICLQQTCPPPVPHCFETIMDGFCCPRYECPVHTVRSAPNSTSLSLTPYDTHSRLHAHTHETGRLQPNRGSNVRGCFVDNKLYGVGHVIESASSPCLECKCDKSGMMKCNPKECTPEDPLLQQINREVLQSTLSRSQVR